MREITNNSKVNRRPKRQWQTSNLKIASASATSAVKSRDNHNNTLTFKLIRRWRPVGIRTGSREQAKIRVSLRLASMSVDTELPELQLQPVIRYSLPAACASYLLAWGDHAENLAGLPPDDHEMPEASPSHASWSHCRCERSPPRTRALRRSRRSCSCKGTASYGARSAAACPTRATYSTAAFTRLRISCKRHGRVSSNGRPSELKRWVAVLHTQLQALTHAARDRAATGWTRATSRASNCALFRCRARASQPSHGSACWSIRSCSSSRPRTASRTRCRCLVPWSASGRCTRRAPAPACQG